MDPIIGARITYVLGLTNIIGLVLVFFSCRCVIGKPFFDKLFQYGWYKKFYNAHCWLWRLFLLSVFLHAAFAIYFFGNPF